MIFASAYSRRALHRNSVWADLVYPWWIAPLWSGFLTHRVGKHTLSYMILYRKHCQSAGLLGSRLSRLSFLVCSFWSLKPQRLETWESASRQKDEHQGCWFWNGFFTGKCTVYVCLLGMKLFICFTKTQFKYLLN